MSELVETLPPQRPRIDLPSERPKIDISPLLRIAVPVALLLAWWAATAAAPRRADSGAERGGRGAVGPGVRRDQ